jgi:methylenetetrahydrofolate--tRNA-(uracil-5-)-methyltransferase
MNAGMTGPGFGEGAQPGGADAKTFQPMKVNFGLFPPIDAKGGRKGRKDRYKAYTDRAKEAFSQWLATQG